MKYLSASRIHLFNQCPLSFYLKYKDGSGYVDDVTEYYASYGSLFHKIVEKIAKKAITYLPFAFQLYDMEFPKCGIPEKNRAEYYQQGKEAIERAFNELQNIEILGQEVEFTTYVDFSIPPLYGFIDLVYRDEKGRLIVRDYKTSKPYGKTELDKQYQPYIYALACKQLYGEYPYMFEFDFVRFDKKKTFMITDSFIKMAEIKIKAVWNRMQKSAHEGNWSVFFCNNFCTQRSLCPLYLRKIDAE